MARSGGTEAIAAELHGLGTRIVEARLGDYDPELESYHGIWRRDSSHALALTRYHTDFLRLAGTGADGKVVLDAGCGYGFTLLLYGLLGAAELHGVDVDEARVRTVAAYRPLLPAELSERLHVRLGDVAALDMETGSADVMLSIEAVGVYRDLEAFAAEAARVLRPGGRLLIAEANNALNPRLRERTVEIWEAYERGEAGSVVHRHRIKSPYVERRERLIAAEHPGLGAERARELAERTAGMTADELRAAVAAHLAGGPRPDSRYERGTLPMAPEGLVVERMVDPYELAELLGRHGLRAKVRGYWGGAGGKPHVRLANRLLSAGGRATIRAAPAFRVVATRA